MNSGQATIQLYWRAWVNNVSHRSPGRLGLGHRITGPTSLLGVIFCYRRHSGPVQYGTWFSRDHFCWGRSKPVCRILWLVTGADVQERLMHVSWFFVLPQWLPGCQTYVVMEGWGYLNGTKQTNQGSEQTGQQKAGWPNIDTLARRKMVIVVSTLAASYMSFFIYSFCHSCSRPCCQSYLKEAKYTGLTDFPAYCCWNPQDIQFKCCLVF